MEIKVTDVTKPQNSSKGGKTWQEITVSYEGKQGAKTKVLRSFEGVVYSAFNDDVANHVPCMVDVTVKKEGDFWQWKDAKVSGNVTSQAAPTTAQSGGVKGNWETAEERAAKQRYIVRQSSIASAIQLLSLRGIENVPTLNEVLNAAKALEDYVFEGTVPEVPTGKRGRKATPADDADPIS